MSSGDTANDGTGDKQRKRKRRWGDAPAATPAPVPAPPPAAPPVDEKAKALALQASIRARLAALKAKTGGNASAAHSVNAGQSAPTATGGVAQPLAAAPTAKRAKRAKHYELDLSVTAPTFKAKKAAPPKPKVNPYLAHTETAHSGENGATSTEGDLVGDDSSIVDERVQASKVRQRHKSLKFVEPGTFIEIAERKRRKAVNAEISGFLSGRKEGTYVNAQTMASIYGPSESLAPEDDDDLNILPVRPEANVKTTMPSVMEWWDLEILPSKLKKQVVAYEGKALQRESQSQMQHNLDSEKAQNKLESLEEKESQDLQTTCWNQAALSYCKTATLIQHIVPIKPPNAKVGPPVEPTLYLTKKELKRQRKFRRQEKQRELQDLQAAGLVPAPEPRLTQKNFFKVLGDQAVLDPSQMEQKALQQMEARQRAHMERNEKNKLTKEQRAAKLAKKLQEDTTQAVHVALFYVKDMSHPYHRTKVDLNAQQNYITGGVLECAAPKLACVICEGGPKAIKRFIRLMTVRMKWKGPEGGQDDFEDEEDDGNDEARPKFNPENSCELVWTGMAVKRFFKGFVFQNCEGGGEAANILRSKGVGHYWDQLIAHASGKGDSFQLKLAESDDDDDISKDNGMDIDERPDMLTSS